MPGFFHYLPMSKEKIVENGLLKLERLPLGLRNAISDCRSAPDDCVVTDAFTSPDGTSTEGCCLYPKGATESALDWRLNLDTQTWIKTVDRWIGWETDRPPGPEDLQRKKQFADYSVKDKQESLWKVPCARSSNIMASSLPTAYTFGDNNGSVKSEIFAEYEQLWKLSAEVMDHFKGRNERDHVWQIKAALQCLSLNYRLDRAEINVLHQIGRSLLNGDTVPTILLCLIDHDLMQEMDSALDSKKKGKSTNEAQSSTSASPGVQEDSPTINPVGAQ